MRSECFPIKDEKSILPLGVAPSTIPVVILNVLSLTKQSHFQIVVIFRKCFNSFISFVLILVCSSAKTMALSSLDSITEE